MPKYPGRGLPLRHNPQDDYGIYPIGAHGNCYGSQSEMLPVRELAMMSIMERLTDKEDWDKKVFDEDIVAKWREEALKIPDEEFAMLAVSGKSQFWRDGELVVEDDSGDHVNRLKGIMSLETFDYCIKELQSKARYFQETGLIPALDACASAAKSDTLVSNKLRESLRLAFERLRADQAESPDWHPNTDKVVQNLVHPSMYPLVYGRSRVLNEELVGVSDAIMHWAGKGEVISKDTMYYDREDDRLNYGSSGDVPPNFWSDTYQWLPANVAFQSDGSVKFTSYINGLHPTKYPEIYRTIEDLIRTALPAWDQCLAMATGYEEKAAAGRVESRFNTFAPLDLDVADADYPENDAMGSDGLKSEVSENFDTEEIEDEGSDEGMYKDIQGTDMEGTEEQVDTDEGKKSVSDRGEDTVDDEMEDDGGEEVYAEDEDEDEDAPRRILFAESIPEPYFEEIGYAPASGTRIHERFEKSGLQIIVKMASIELTPESPEFPAGGWHIEGQMNEHICATALYYLDSENISSSNLAFRMQTSEYMDDHRSRQSSYSWEENIHGTALTGDCSPCLQNYGNIETREGRLLAFPNVFQHRVSPFHLIDPTKPGHRRFIALWLVDPTIRIISTANVPPQQQDWWVEAVLGQDPASRSAAAAKIPVEVLALLAEKQLLLDPKHASDVRLPAELMQAVRDFFEASADTLPMGLEEAKEHRLKLMEARGAFHKDSEEGWQMRSYSFCEH